MKNYQKTIKQIEKLKYKNSTIFRKNFLKSYFNSRTELLNKIKVNKKFKIIKQDKTLKNIQKLSEKKINNRDVILESFYKKYEVNLLLKSRYNKNQKKITNDETNINAYLYLALTIFNYRFLNRFQKLNIILKITDKFIIYKNILKKTDHALLKKIILLEMKLIKNIN